ncbi:MAG TPA: (E)-4-hydroxy-3-methylbut-2-enyl-diphosphate synthase [Chlamydiales bacterium]|nr:(E)-4-hydroxy-3-methylbut-2-enyl-diphosphate synthase [Chlamydiales bacterium]
MTELQTVAVAIGNVMIGKDHPIAIQSMTNTATEDIEKTVDQIEKLSDAGCDIVRLAVQSQKQVDSLKEIKKKLLEKNIKIPLVADIHFYAQAAIEAAKTVDKVRINPGNFTTALRNENLSKLEAIEAIEKASLPLIEICKEKKVAIRIGVNHGSLSPYILKHFGNTAEGMVASALDFLEVFEKHGFQNLVFSMKASSVKIMIKAYQLLVDKMLARKKIYPLHLGVTEAGEGFEGRIKSFAGIGGLLLSGIGDTIRVSLTEDPINEIAAAKKLIEDCQNIQRQAGIYSSLSPISIEKQMDPISGFFSVEPNVLDENSYFLSKDSKAIRSKSQFVFDNKENVYLNSEKHIIAPFGHHLMQKENLAVICPLNFSFMSKLKEEIQKKKSNARILLQLTGDDFLQFAPLGLLLLDESIQGICIDSSKSFKEDEHFLHTLYQALGLKRFHAEYISCPGCGRTKYDLQKLAREVKENTQKYSHLKFAVMGCIVNGLGEMADADFGFIGSKQDHVHLYHKKNCLLKDIPVEKALEKLLSILEEK